MVGNRGKIIFQVSIVINVIVLFYGALHLSGNHPSPQIVWEPITSDDVVREDSGVRNEELTSNITPSTMPSTNKTTSSTATIADIKWQDTLPETGGTNESLNSLNKRSVTEETSVRLRSLLACNDKDFLPEYLQRGKYWVLKNYIRANHGHINCHDSVTYTTHAGFEFLDNVQPLVERWQNPVSLAIHAPGDDFVPTMKSIRYLRECLDTDLVKLYVTFHIFFPDDHIPDKIPQMPEEALHAYLDCSVPPPFMNENLNNTYMKTKGLLYPVNVARNIARDAALTHFILPSDIELYPSPNLVTQFLEMVARNEEPLSTSKNPRVFPISLFEVNADAKVPLTKAELQAMLKKKTAITFHKHMCPACHNIPNGDQWNKAKETDGMQIFHIGKRKGKFIHWEPIFIGTHQDPYYDERLSWEGKRDKMPQGYILCVKDYDFMILNNAFLVHKPGIKHYKKDTRRDSLATKQGSFVGKVVHAELKKLFGTRPGCAL